MRAAYDHVSTTITKRYQGTRAPLDFEGALKTIKQDVEAGQAMKGDAKSASAAAAGAAAARGFAAPAPVTPPWQTKLDFDLADALGKPATVKVMRPLLPRLLSTRFDPVRTLGADRTLCEALALN